MVVECEDEDDRDWKGENGAFVLPVMFYFSSWMVIPQIRSHCVNSLSYTFMNCISSYVSYFHKMFILESKLVWNS